MNYGDQLVPNANDISYGPINLSKSLMFYNRLYNQIYICTNGYVTFESNDQFNELDINQVKLSKLAVLFGDLDNKKYGSIFYREVTDKPTLSEIATILYQDYNQLLNINYGFVVTWKDIPSYGIYDKSVRPNNTFQLIIGAEAGRSSYAIFTYKDVSLDTSNFTAAISFDNTYSFKKEINEEMRTALKSGSPYKFTFELNKLNKACLLAFDRHILVLCLILVKLLFGLV